MLDQSAYWRISDIRHSIQYTWSRYIMYKLKTPIYEATITFVVQILQVTRGCWWRWFTIDVPPSSLNLALRWLLFYLFCSSVVVNTVIVTVEPLNRNESGRFCAVESHSTHHLFGNACTMSESLRFSQFSGRWLILSVYILMSFYFPFVLRLLGVR